MTNVYDVPKGKLIENTAEELKKIPEIRAPDWASYVKTGMSRERPPLRKDWWMIRAAAVLRWVKERGPVGVSKLRTKFGGKKNRGVKPDKFYKASGNILRKILQQLESAGLVIKKADTPRKGRVITPKGVSLLDKVSNSIPEKVVSPKVMSNKVTEKNEKSAEVKKEIKNQKEEPKKDKNG